MERTDTQVSTRPTGRGYDWLKEAVEDINKGPKYEGFTREQEAWMRGAIDVIGLPRKNVYRVVYEPNSTENSNWLGSFNYNKGSLTLYSRLAHVDTEDTQPMSTIFHEEIHSCTSFDGNNDELYGGEEQRETVKQYIYDVAQQAFVTDIPLNGYHKELLGKFRSGEISFGRYFRETEAIMLQMRIFNEDDLKKVQERQRTKLEELKLTDPSLAGLEFTEMLGTERSEACADAVLTTLFEGVETREECQARIAAIRSYTQEKGNPFKVATDHKTS